MSYRNSYGRQREEPRPTCPECGKTVHPERAVPYNVDITKPVSHMLTGIYCSSDCVLDAHRRGYPGERARRS